MKVSLNWIKQFTAVDMPVDELVAKIGAQLGEVESVESLDEKYRGTIIAKVITYENHPNADRLHVCTIDDGGITPDVKRDENGYVQVVCGAPNVAAGVTVVWLPPGSTVPESYGKDPFVLEARELRGVVSNGMLASPKELALGDSHEGLLLLEDDKQPGISFAEAYKLNDMIIDIENKMFTHRPDLFGQLGVAREMAGITGQQFSSPDWYQQLKLNVLEPTSTGLPLEVRNELPESVPRFMAVALSDVVIKPSPIWLQTYLSRVGVRPINNVVDITNYIMLLTGQPLHAYDYDKVKKLSSGEAAMLVVRNPRENEKIILLNGKMVDPRQEAIMIATDQQLIGIGGVMGGAETEVDANTKNLILEVATFDMYSIRRTSMAHGLFTDAVTRFNKGQSPLQNPYVIGEAIQLLGEHSGAKQASDIIDNNQVEGREGVHPPVPVSAEFINARLGLQLSAEQMELLLTNVEFKITVENENLTVTAPFWRTDIETREDVVEEIGRLHGYDKLPLELPHRSIKPIVKNDLLELKSRVRENLVKSGANELLTYSFVHGNLLGKSGQDQEQAFKLGNAPSPDLQYYRLSLTPSLLDKVHPNIKAGYDEFALFEIGKAHNLQQKTEDGLPMGFEMLDVVYAARDKVAQPGAAFYQARKLLTNLAAEFGLQLDFRPFKNEEDYQVVKPYDHTRSAQIFVKGIDLPLGMIGEYKAAVRKNLKLPTHSAGFGIGLTQLLQAARSADHNYITLPRFPKVTQDLTLKVTADLPYQELYDFVWDELAKTQPEQTLPSLGPVGIYKSVDDPQRKHITFRLSIASYQKTMTDAEVTQLLDSVAAAAQQKFSAERL